MSKNGKKVLVDPDDLVGTAEAAEILGVERPRIGRWRERGIMPEPIRQLAATPLWTKDQIKALRDDRKGMRRRPPVKAAKKSARKRATA